MDKLLFSDDFSSPKDCWEVGIGGGVGTWQTHEGILSYRRVVCNPAMRTPAYFIAHREGLGKIHRVTCKVRLEQTCAVASVLTCFGFQGGYCLRLSHSGDALHAEMLESGLLSAAFFSPLSSAYDVKDVFDSRRWYQVRLETTQEGIRAFVDETLVFSCKAPAGGNRFAQGTVGFQTTGGDCAFSTLFMYGEEYEKKAPTPNFDAGLQTATFFSIDHSSNWTVDANQSVWRIEDTGTLEYISGTQWAEAYVHCFEENPSVKLTLKLDAPLKKDALWGIALRALNQACYVRVGVGDDGLWYVWEREGMDFEEKKKPLPLLPAPPIGKIFSLNFRLDGRSLNCSMDGRQDCVHVPLDYVDAGRIGVFCQGAALHVLSLEAVLRGGGNVVSGIRQGQVMPNDYSNCMEFIQTPDGRLLGVHSGHSYIADSDDTWFEQADAAYAGVNRGGGYSTLFRLPDGHYLQVLESTVVEESVDLKTWQEIGRILSSEEVKDDAGRQRSIFHVGSMTQAKLKNGTLRLFMPIALRRYDGNRILGHYTRIFYSDDTGKNWSESKGDTRQLYTPEELSQNASFTESKVVACRDGRMRLYCTRSQFGCLSCMESFDEGESFNGIVHLEQFPCAMSSFGVDRDPLTDYGYYLAYVKNIPYNKGNLFPRTDLVLLHSEDGMTWHEVMTLERVHNAVHPLSHQVGQILDPSVRVLRDRIIVGYGACSRTGEGFHNQQRAWCVVIKRPLRCCKHRVCAM